MPIRTIATLSVAILLGLIAVLAAQFWLGRQRQADQQSAALAGTLPVVVASQPIGRGMALTPALLKVVRYPQGSVPPGAMSSIEQATAGGQRLVLRPLAPNEPVLPGKITVPGGRVNLSAAMTQGMRGVTFRSNDVAGVAGFVLPGDRVDVLLTRDVGGPAGTDAGKMNVVTQVLAENIKVLGVDQVSDDTAEAPVVAKAITLEMTPDQAQAISLAQAVGNVSLALRQVADEEPVTRQVTTVADLGGYRSFATTPVSYSPRAYAPRAAAPRAPSGPEVKVTRGVETKSYTVAR